jgi:hypothetical protein
MQEMARRRKKIPESEFKEGPQGLKVDRGGDDRTQQAGVGSRSAAKSEG